MLLLDIHKILLWTKKILLDTAPFRKIPHSHLIINSYIRIIKRGTSRWNKSELFTQIQILHKGDPIGGLTPCITKYNTLSQAEYHHSGGYLSKLKIQIAQMETKGHLAWLKVQVLHISFTHFFKMSLFHIIIDYGSSH